jgi:pectinesterase
VNGRTSIDNVAVAEYANTDVGIQKTKADFTQKVRSKVRIEDILGSAWKDEWWVNAGYM